VAQSRGGACFCTRGAMQDYAVISLFSRWQKPCLTGVSQAGVTPGGSPRREPGQAVALATKPPLYLPNCRATERQ